MLTIAEPKEHIDKLWGKQQVREDAIYRLMRYVFRVDHGGKVLLHNVVTGRLAVLDEAEAEALNKLPSAYSPALNQLVAEHYLVPEDYDEHQQVINLRSILRKLMNADDHHNAVKNYTILPTTACNARCYYCFEQGIEAVTMTEQIAEQTVTFIAKHCGPDKKVSIRWFGGEPTVASHRIDQICKGLRGNGIRYSSSMTTNGYLFDEEMVSRAKALWNLKEVMICVDGTEKNYNEIKSYVNPTENPYQRVLRNIGLLLDRGISVTLRMNFDLGNVQDFKDVLKEARERFQGNKLLQVYAFPLKGEYPDRNGRILHGSESWFDEKIAELNDMARAAGLFRRDFELPSLFFTECSAGNPSFMVITAQGKLGRCTGIFNDEDQIVGSVANGVADSDFYKPWREFAEPNQCVGCALFPKCVLIEKCPGKDRCFLKETFRQIEEAVKSVFDEWKDNDQKGVMSRDFPGTEGGVCSD